MVSRQSTQDIIIRVSFPAHTEFPCMRIVARPEFNIVVCMRIVGVSKALQRYCGPCLRDLKPLACSKPCMRFGCGLVDSTRVTSSFYLGPEVLCKGTSIKFLFLSAYMTKKFYKTERDLGSRGTFGGKQVDTKLTRLLVIIRTCI